MNGRRRRELDPISDSLLHACEEYLRGFEQHALPERMDQLADSIQQLFLQRKWRDDDGLPWPSEELIPTTQVFEYDDITSKQFLRWVSTIHELLKQRMATRYG